MSRLFLWPLRDGGSIFQVLIKAPLLIEIRMRIVYRDARDTTLMTSRLSDSSYINTTTLYYIEHSVPYDCFHVMVGLVYEDKEGLLFSDGIIHTSKHVNRLQSMISV